MANSINARIPIKSDTAAKWASSALILLKGEMALEIDTGKFKFGDGTKPFNELSYNNLTVQEISNLITNSTVQSVSVATGTNNGTIKLIVNGVVYDNISVKGLGTAAYTDTSAYATAAQGTLATNAMPKSGGTFTGNVTLKSDPTSALMPATKQYVDTQLSSGIAANDYMRLIGTIGTGGTSTTLPTTARIGDTYKIITALSIPAASSSTGSAVNVQDGDTIVAMTTTPTWLVIPSGDEIVTTVKYSTSTTNLTTAAKSGGITLGYAAVKQVDDSIDAASTSTNLPTSNAVAAFVEGKGYVAENNKVTNTLATTTKAYLTGTASATTNTGAQVFDTGVYLDTTAGKLVAATFAGDLTGNVTGNVSGSSGSCTGNAATATTLSTARTIALSQGVIATATSFNGSANITIPVTSVNTDYLVNGADTLILNCGDSNS